MIRQTVNLQPVAVNWQCFVAAALSIVLVGCMTMQPLNNDSAFLARELHQGDELELVTRDGRTQKFKVVAVDAEGISGDNVRVAYGDISRIQRRELDGTRTTLLVLGVIAAGAIAAGGGGSGGSGGGGY